MSGRLQSLAEREAQLQRQLALVRGQMTEEARRYSDSRGFRVRLTPAQVLADMSSAERRAG